MTRYRITTACCVCRVDIVMTPDQESQLRQSGGTFHCIWGHAQHFTRGPSEADKLRQERDRLKQQQARLIEERQAADRRADAAQRSARAFKGQVTRIKGRVAAGVCPCCNRTFQDLARHMKGQHPEFTTDEPTD